jgi:glutamyl-tRNA synthetase
MHRAIISSDFTLEQLRVALISYLCAKRANDKFLIRVEDLDKQSHTQDANIDALETLTLFGVSYDYLYYQSENAKYHLQLAANLMGKGLAFACFCTPKELQTQSYSGKCINISQDELLNNNLPFTIRIKKPNNALHVKDTLGEEIILESDAIDSFIIMSQEKYASCEFANACDDMLQGISHIIALDSIQTARGLHIRNSLGYVQELRYTHLPPLLDANKSVKELLNEGFLPEAILNYLLYLGNKTPMKIFTLAEALEWFSLENISKSPVQFDINMLQDFNKEHIRRLEDIEVSKIIGYSSNDIGRLAKLYTQEVSTTFEIKQRVDGVFAQKSTQRYPKNLSKLKEVAKKAPYFEEFEEFQTYMMQKSALEGEEFLLALRILLTNQESGPNLKDLYTHIKHYLGEITR